MTEEELVGMVEAMITPQLRIVRTVQAMIAPQIRLMQWVASIQNDIKGMVRPAQEETLMPRFEIRPMKLHEYERSNRECMLARSEYDEQKVLTLQRGNFSIRVNAEIQSQKLIGFLLRWRRKVRVFISSADLTRLGLDATPLPTKGYSMYEGDQPFGNENGWKITDFHESPGASETWEVHFERIDAE